MKAQIIRLALVCALSLAFVGCASTGHHHIVWEYRILQVVQRDDGRDGEKQLNELAREGWVLVSESTSEQGLPRLTFVLKRPLKP
jgi:hypothetical protein